MSIGNIMQNMIGRGVVTRVAPSPTGLLHVGVARVALFNFLFAKKYGGTFILRIEDTDRERSKKGFEENILAGISWLGLKYDALYRQSDRGVWYRKSLRKLIDEGHAYPSKEERKDALGEEIEVVRLKNPNKDVVFTDIIRGDIVFNTTELGDFVIAKSIDEPLYHLAVVVDDRAMGITHVIRGEDHISNTPRQILIQEALGIKRPHYAHIPLILGADRRKLSKRDSVFALTDYANAGYLPEAMVNYLALLGWNPDSERETFSLKELIREFDLSKVHKGGAIFDLEKLNWFNREYIKKLPTDTIYKEVERELPDRIKKMEGYTPKKLSKIAPIIAERMNVFSDISHIANSGDLDYYFEKPKYEGRGLFWKGQGESAEVASHLNTLVTLIEKIPVHAFTKKTVKNTVWDYADKEGRGVVLWPMRYALSGKEKSPDPFSLADVLGKEETLERLRIGAERAQQPS